MSMKKDPLTVATGLQSLEMYPAFFLEAAPFGRPEEWGSLYVCVGMPENNVETQPTRVHRREVTECQLPQPGQPGLS